MANPLRFHPLVVEDLKAATDWYDGIEIRVDVMFYRSAQARHSLVPPDLILKGTVRQELERLGSRATSGGCSASWGD